VEAQQRSQIARIGVLRVDARTSPGAMEAIADLKRGLSDLGYVEEQNIAFEIRWAENKLEHLPILASELVQLKVDVIVTSGAAGHEGDQRSNQHDFYVMAARSIVRR